MDPWYRVAQLREEVREGRSFNPNEFAIALEQVVAGRGPEDYRDPVKFFARTYFTAALRDHAALVLRRLAGETANTAPVLTLITQFGGGKTHTLTALYHLARLGRAAVDLPGADRVLRDAGLGEPPAAKVGVFVGNAWDPSEGRETPWIDLARQLAGDDGVRALGDSARTAPPGTNALTRLFEVAGGRVLVLCDEVLNFFNRYREMAEPFYAFVQNLTVAMTGTTHSAAVLSLPRSPVEMTDPDREWLDRITKVVNRVAKELLANNEAEVSEVIRRRLFESLGREATGKSVARAYADWCFERRAQLPPEWTAVDTAATEAKAREFLRARFEACYPFHPATLSVFQRKWQGLPQYQQTRGTLAMLAQWISVAALDGFKKARTEPLITLGSAPLDRPEFRAVVLGQLGEPRLEAAILTDLVAENSHAKALDSDTKGPLKDIHRRVGLAAFFESSGGMAEAHRAAHLPELRFAIGEPDVETTSVDGAAMALETRGYYLRKVGTDGYRFGFQPTLKKVVNDRRASLGDDEVDKAVRDLVRKEFERRAALPLQFFPSDGTAVSDSHRLTLVVADPARAWDGKQATRQRIAEWTQRRGDSPRLAPGAIIWCMRRPGRDLRHKVEMWLAWQRVAADLAEGVLGAEFDRAERAAVTSNVKDAEDQALDEVWAEYRFVLLADRAAEEGLAVIDLGPGHRTGNETITARVVAALKSESYLNEGGVGAGYLERKWPEAFKRSGAWPLGELRRAFLNGSLPRVLDIDAVLRAKIVEFVGRGDFGLASGEQPAGGFSRWWFKELISADEVVFDNQTFLLLRAPAEGLAVPPAPVVAPEPPPAAPLSGPLASGGVPAATTVAGPVTVRISGSIPPELWIRVGNRLLPKLKSGESLEVSVGLVVKAEPAQATHLVAEIRQILADIGLTDRLRVETP